MEATAPPIEVLPTEHPYIVRQSNILGGEPIIKGTRTPVRAIVENWRLGVRTEDLARRVTDVLNEFTADELVNLLLKF